MAEYAHVISGNVHTLADIPASVHADWSARGNPKANAYRPVVDDPLPIYDPTIQVVDASFVVEPTAVRRVWTVRPKTKDERRKTWTSYVFLRRFTPQERDDIRTAAASDGAVADLMMFLQTATEVVSDDDTTAVGMDYLVHLGILSPARRAELMS